MDGNRTRHIGITHGRIALMLRTALLALVTISIAFVALSRLDLSYDLAAFLPPPGNDAQRVLLERLGQGPGAQLIFVKMPGVTREEASHIAEKLRASTHVGRVLPETSTPGAESIPRAIWQRRLLLGNLPETEHEWRAILDQRLDDLSLSGDPDLLDVISADPALLAIDALTEFAALAGDAGFQTDDAQYLLVETAGAGFDIGAQQAAVESVRRAVATVPAATLYGNGVYGTDLQAAVRNESTLFSAAASLLLAGLVWWRFRSISRLIGVGLPLLAGGACGLLVLTLLPGEVHGITLAFGFTLLGVAIDYPLHIYTHQTPVEETGNSPAPRIWPTLRLGIASTLIGYGAFLFSGTPGLRQLGVFAVSGVVVAALSAAWLGAKAAPGQDARNDSTVAPAPRLRHVPWTLALLLTAPWLLWLHVFDDDLSSLTPIDPELLAEDAATRHALGVADIRYLVAVRHRGLQDALQTTERVAERLARLRDGNGLQGVQSVLPLLPSEVTQRARRQHLNDPAARSLFLDALADSPFQADAFQPFLEAITREASASDWLSPASYDDSADLSRALTSLLYPSDDEWVSLLYLRGLRDAAAVASSLSDVPGAQLIDLKQTSMDMVAAYRNRLLSLLAIALVLISILLCVGRNVAQSLWMIGTVTSAVSCAAVGSYLWQAGLSLFDLMALTLVAGLGLDYALFYSRPSAPGEARLTRSAVSICALSSLIVFGILSFSTIPVLSGIGTTVALGVGAAYLLSRYGHNANAGS